jgi:hypothetical protein
VKPGMLCLLLLSACDFLSPSAGPPTVYQYTLTWTCLSAEGCERTDEVERIDRMDLVDRESHFTSTQDESFAEDARLIAGDSLPSGCSWLYYLSFLGHELERSRFCITPAGFELEVSIPNQDPTTHSLWLVEGRVLGL